MFVAYACGYAHDRLEVHIDRMSMDGNEKSKKHVVDDNVQGPDVRLHYSRELKKLFWADTDNGKIESVNLDGE